MDKVKEFQGILKSYDDETVTIEENGNDITFEKKNIAIIRLAIDF